MVTIDNIVKAVCPEFPNDRKVVETMVADKYYHVDCREMTLFVPLVGVLRANLSEIDKFSEAVNAFAVRTDFTPIHWELPKTPEHHSDPESIMQRLNKLREQVAQDAVDPYMAIDIETDRVFWDNNHILCFGIAYQTKDGQEHTVSFDMDTPVSSEFFSEFFTDKLIHFIWQNGKFDTGRLKYIRQVTARVDEDTMLMHYVGINERRGTHGLKELGELYLEAPKWDDELKEFKARWCRAHGLKQSEFSYGDIPRSVLIPYLHMDCLSTLRLFHLFNKIMRPESHGIYRQLTRASNIYREVELNGVKLDCNYLEELGDILMGRLDRADRDVQEAAEALWDPCQYTIDSGARTVPKKFNMKSPKQLKWLLEKIMQRKVEGTGKDILEKLADEADSVSNEMGKKFLKAIHEQRKASKYLDTYVTGIQETLCKDGRVRATYNLHGTETGRLSCSDPNMQNIPRDKLIKNLFVAPEGKVFVQADYSQAELRVLAYLSDDDWLTDVYVQGHDLHDRVATQMFGPDFNKEQRVMAKTINFGIAYGRGASNIAEVFHLSIPEAQKLINNWFVPMPKVKAYLDGQKRKPFHNIPVETPFGRRRSFIITPENTYSIKNEAMNMSIQSTASDCTLLSLCAIQEWIVSNHLEDDVKICITVHDSIVIEVTDNEELVRKVSNQCTSIMANTPKQFLPNCRVPFRADIELGRSWGNMKEIDEYYGH